MYLQQNGLLNRSRIVVELAPTMQDYVVKETGRLFVALSEIEVRNSMISRVGASKILFATLPEIALPVDNVEWDYVFETENYEEILSTMINEIKEWERKTGHKLETVEQNGHTTLPSIYNVMAMSARPLDKLM
jgi:hypothetical protein